MNWKKITWIALVIITFVALGFCFGVYLNERDYAKMTWVVIALALYTSALLLKRKVEYQEQLFKELAAGVAGLRKEIEDIKTGAKHEEDIFKQHGLENVPEIK